MIAPLYVVTAVFNPERYRSRYRLYWDFEKHVIDSGGQLFTVEAAFGERPFEVTRPDEPNHIQVRTDSEIWLKENLLNIGVSRLPKDWKYVAWVDADVHFARPDWVSETVQQLQHFNVVQMFSYAMDMAPDYSGLEHTYGIGIRPASWAYCYVNDMPKVNTNLRKTLEDGRMSKEVRKTSDGYGLLKGNYYWHPGFAWAMRRKTWDDVGGLIDYSVLGAADYLMAAAMTGDLALSDWMNPNYKRWIWEWKKRADKYINGNVGYVPGLLMHHWHGKKASRGYKDRWKIFRDHNFDPELDLKKDWQGVWQLTDRSSGLRDDIRKYFRARDEDSTP